MSRARDFADLAGSADAGGLTGRNLIINGAMQVAQRGTSETGVTTSTFVCDRFQFAASGTIGTYTLAQSTTAPDGFAYSLKLDTTTADASPAGTDNLTIRYKIEGQDLQRFKFGTASAESMTLSFWCRSNKTGDIQVNLRNMDAGRIIAAAVSINSANTWEYKTVTVAGDTSSGFTNDNGESLRIEWFLDVGPDWSSGAVPTSWEALSAGDLGAGVTLALADNTANEFLLTGVQLEVGEQATPFEHRSYGDELRRCQRYFFKSYPTNRYAGFNTANDVREGACVTRNQDGSARSANAWPFHYPVTMRTQPTITSYSLNGTSGKVSQLDGNLDHSSDQNNNGYYETAHQNGWQIVEASLDGLGFGGFHVYSDAEL